MSIIESGSTINLADLRSELAGRLALWLMGSSWLALMYAAFTRGRLSTIGLLIFLMTLGGAVIMANRDHPRLARHFMGLVSEQSLYNLNARTVELEVVPACRAYGLGLLPWSPLGGGLLAGALQKQQEGRRASTKIQQAVEQHQNQLEAYETLCRELGQAPANVALAWLLHTPPVTAPIIGPRTMAQLETNLQAIEITLPDEVLTRLDGIWPGPGGEAPEAYAW